jgi:hypothetical protein
MKHTTKTKRATSWIIVAAVFAMGLLAATPGQALAGNNEDGSENLIRSAMIYNFCKFVQWPETELDTLVLGVMAKPDKETDFSSIEGKEVHDSFIDVKPVHSAEDMAGCQLVFIPKDMDHELDVAFATAQSESVLTISEIDGFCSQGGMIQLVERRGKLRFFINNKAAGDSHLILSSQLLKMAKIVDGS